MSVRNFVNNGSTKFSNFLARISKKCLMLYPVALKATFGFFVKYIMHIRFHNIKDNMISAEINSKWLNVNRWSMCPGLPYVNHMWL